MIFTITLSNGMVFNFNGKNGEVRITLNDGVEIIGEVTVKLEDILRGLQLCMT